MQISTHGIVHASSIDDTDLILSGTPGAFISTLNGVLLPNGWSKVFEDTNKAVYQSDNVQGSQLYLWVDDTTTTFARIRGYKSMSSIDVGVGPFPTDSQLNGGFYVYKSNSSSTAPRKWDVFADSRMFYFTCDANDSGNFYGGMAFGDGKSYLQGDVFGGMISGSVGPSAYWYFPNMTSTNSIFLCSSYNNSVESVALKLYSHGKSTALGSNYQSFPSEVDNRVHFWPVAYWEGSTCERGLCAGIWNPIHTQIPDRLIITDIPELPGREILIKTISGAYNIGFDLTGPWR